MNLRRLLLTMALGAIAVTAALGLYAVLVPNFGVLQAKVLATSAAISVGCMIALACAPAYERRLLMPLPPATALLTLVVVLLLLYGMWNEVGGDGYWRLFTSLLLLDLWGVLTCLLVLARLAPRYHWVFYAAIGLSLLLVLIGVGALWGHATASTYGRLTGAVAVLSAAFVLAVPVLHRASRDEIEPAPTADVRFCPNCGAPEPDQAGEATTCTRCGKRFQVHFL